MHLNRTIDVCYKYVFWTLFVIRRIKWIVAAGGFLPNYKKNLVKLKIILMEFSPYMYQSSRDIIALKKKICLKINHTRKKVLKKSCIQIKIPLKIKLIQSFYQSINFMHFEHVFKDFELLNKYDNYRIIFKLQVKIK